MDASKLICHYVCDQEQVRASFKVFIWNSRFRWIHLWSMANFGLISIAFVYEAFWDAQSRIMLLIDFAVMLIPLTMILAQIQNYWPRRRTFLDQDLTCRLDENGVTMEAPHLKTDFGWTRSATACEGDKGFLIFYRGQNLATWLPKDGFDGVESINRCREMLRHRIKRTSLKRSA